MPDACQSCGVATSHNCPECQVTTCTACLYERGGVSMCAECADAYDDAQKSEEDDPMFE